jgi:hypothetical protein
MRSVIVLLAICSCQVLDSVTGVNRFFSRAFLLASSNLTDRGLRGVCLLN